ncbi:hypothetical protein RJT34_14171 [Clitoria ternatea]|uniref:Uncharacterized protein n=1 Tax=Clitoria ternatea TaxID=43366 RepID=A0AAN9JS37_CLITE
MVALSTVEVGDRPEVGPRHQKFQAQPCKILIRVVLQILNPGGALYYGQCDLLDPGAVNQQASTVLPDVVMTKAISFPEGKSYQPRHIHCLSIASQFSLILSLALRNRFYNTIETNQLVVIILLLVGCKNPLVLGCIAESAMMRKAASLAFSNKKRSTVTGDIIECLGKR